MHVHVLNSHRGADNWYKKMRAIVVLLFVSSLRWQCQNLALDKNIDFVYFLSDDADYGTSNYLHYIRQIDQYQLSICVRLTQNRLTIVYQWKLVVQNCCNANTGWTAVSS